MDRPNYKVLYTILLTDLVKIACNSGISELLLVESIDYGIYCGRNQVLFFRTNIIMAHIIIANSKLFTPIWKATKYDYKGDKIRIY